MADSDFSEVRKLAADLNRASVSTTNMASKVVAKTAFDIEADAKNRAPVDTGHLRNSIGSNIKHLTAEIGPTAAYGAHVEYGTHRTRPQPYMGPAADKVMPAFVAAMRQLGGEIPK